MKTIICTYKEEQKIKTELEKQRLLKSGMQFVSLEEYKKMVESFGLKLVIMDKYYNNLNDFGSWLECMVDAEDETKKSYANVYGKFYQEEIQKRTKKYLEFKEFRNTFFTQLPTKHLINI